MTKAANDVKRNADGADHVKDCKEEQKGLPDGGFGWVVVVGALVIEAVTAIITSSFSMLYLSYAEAFGTNQATTGWIGSLQLFMSGVIGVVFGFLIEGYGTRKISIVGSLFFASGVFICAFAPNIYVLYAAMTVLTGPGHGILNLSARVIVQQWFDKKRPIAGSISDIGMPLGVMITGPLTRYMEDKFGWRGTLTIYAGISLNCLVCSALFRPPCSHWMTSLEKVVGSVEPKSKLGLCCKSITKVFNFSILKNASFIIMALGTLLLNYGLQTLKYHSPARAIHKGVHLDYVQFLQVVHGVASITGRVVGGTLANIRHSILPLQYAFAVIVGGIALCFVGLTGDRFLYIALAMSASSFMSGVYLGIQFTYLTFLVGLSQVAHSSGMLFLFFSIASLTVTPFSGWIFDISGNYDLPFFACGGIQIAGGLLLLVIPCCLQRKRSDKTSITDSWGEPRVYVQVKVNITSRNEEGKMEEEVHITLL